MTRVFLAMATALAIGCAPQPQSIASNLPSDTSNAPPVAASSTSNAAAVDSSTPAPSASASPADDREKRIQEKFGKICRYERACGGLWGIDCAAASDGPYYYVKAETLETVSECGGFCRGGRCTSCPPKEWTCATY